MKGLIVALLLVLLGTAQAGAEPAAEPSAVPQASPTSSATPSESPSPQASPSASPKEAVPTKKKPIWSFDGDYRVQSEHWDWWTPPDNTTGTYTFVGLRTRARVRYDNPGLSGIFELQDTQMSGLPTNAIGPQPVGQLGGGAGYYNVVQRNSINTMGLRQFNLKIGDPKGFQAQVGRLDYQSALQVMPGDEILDWLVRNRLRDRMIGVNLFSNYGRTFDGVRLDFDTSTDRFTGFVAHPTQGATEAHFGVEMPNVTISEVAWTLKRSKRLPNSEAQIFWVHYGDDRQVPYATSDNRLLARTQTLASQGGNKYDTYGFHFITRIKDFDGLAWYAHQTGKWGTTTHLADAYVLEAGYRFSKTPWKPWIRGGYFSSTGDPNPRDRYHNTFVAPLPTNRLTARFPFFNNMNLNDAYMQFMVQPSSKTFVRMDYHWLALNNPRDLWYSGSGASQNKGSINGFSGRSGFGFSSLAQFVDISIDQQINDKSNIVLYFARAFAGKAVNAVFPGPNASAFFVEYNLKFP